MDDQYFMLHNSCRENTGKYNVVLFLDIDGVLNNFDDRTGNRVLIDEKMVSRLKRITDLSNAKIILTSSWRIYYHSLNNRDDNVPDAHFSALLRMFEKYTLTISGITNEIGFGKDSRPLEIRHWLLDKPDVERFAILDDMDWNWGWLSDHVVCTRRVDSSSLSGWSSGLNMDNVRDALRILKIVNDPSTLL